jgi:pimeloyl-ACP methyl ester carboxylesterase
MDSRMWDDQFPRLAVEFHVIRYDIRGYGKSPPADKPFFHHEDLHALLDHLRIDKASLVGLSLGGAIAIDFALAYPQRIEKLVAVAPGLGGFDWSADSFAGWRRIVSAAQAGDPDRAADLWLAEPMMAGVNENPAVRQRVRQILVDNGHCWLNNPLLERELDPPAARRLSQIRAPTLAIVGDRDVADIQRIVQQIDVEVPGARKVVIPGASHILNMERPAEFDRVLLEFLRTSPASID